MKEYVKPKLELVELTVEERFASGSCTLKDGYCSVNGNVIYWA